MPYSQDFPYSRITRKMVAPLDDWMELKRNHESIGQMFLNASALTFEDIEDKINEMLYNQYIGTANLGQIDWIRKRNIPREHVQGGILSIEVKLADGTALEEKETLREFYESGYDSNAFMIDYDEAVIYVRNREYAEIELHKDGSLIEENDRSLSLHHIWNSFDELALLVGLKRRHGETNFEFKDRILNVFRFKGGPNKLGLINHIGGQLDLWDSKVWPAGTTTQNVPTTASAGRDVIPETLNINGEQLYDSQLEEYKANSTITSKLELKDLDIENMQFDGCVYDHNTKVFKLVEGETSGTIETEIILPPNLDTWTTITITTEDLDNIDSVKVSVLSHNDIMLYEDVASGTNLGIESSIKLLIEMEDLSDGSSPKLSSVDLDYSPTDSVVYYIHSVELNELHDEEYKSTLYNHDGSPKEQLRRYAEELNRVIPVLWGHFKWDESYWDVVSKNLVGFDVLPHLWDPHFNPSDFEGRVQAGIGYGLDCKVKIEDSWNPKIHSGYYYAGSDLEESYLYASSNSMTGVSTTSAQLKLASRPSLNAPITVMHNGEELTQVAFLDDDFRLTIENTENSVVVEENGEKKAYITYPSPKVTSIIYYDDSGNEITTTSVADESDADNIITFGSADTIPVGQEIIVSYKVDMSYYVDGDTLHFDRDYTGLDITYETAVDSSYYTSSVNLDPMKNHFNSGYLYIADEIEPLDRATVYANPDVLSANNTHRSLIVIDALDSFGNPYYSAEWDYAIETYDNDPEDPSVTSTLITTVGTIKEGTTGTLTIASDNPFGNRYCVYYYADSIPTAANGTAYVKITFTSGSVSEYVIIKVKE